MNRLTHAERIDYLRSHRRDLVGEVLVGVVTTGIYCLPTCPARAAKAQNIRLFANEEDARAVGLRPCKRCRPDDFYRDFNPDAEGLEALVDGIRRAPAQFTKLHPLAAVIGWGPTKLHQQFRLHYHASPAAFVRQARVQAACKMLADPDRSISEVGREAGYRSHSAFHGNFRGALGMSPRDYQRLGSSNTFTVSMPPSNLPWVAQRMLGRDPESPVEQFHGKRAVKALREGSHTVLLEMEWEAGRVRCTAHGGPPPNFQFMRSLHAKAVRMLGLQSHPAAFESRCARNPDVARLVERRRGLRVPLTADVFEAVTWAVVGQRVNLAYACRLRRALVHLCGQPADVPGLVAHPTADEVASVEYGDLTKRGFARRAAEYLVDTAGVLASGELVLDPLLPVGVLERKLLAVRGMGPWSAQYILMRGLGFGDCVPAGDAVLSSALQRFYGLGHRPDAKETAERMGTFSPHRSLATVHFWMTPGGPSS